MPRRGRPAKVRHMAGESETSASALTSVPVIGRKTVQQDLGAGLRGLD